MSPFCSSLFLAIDLRSLSSSSRFLVLRFLDFAFELGSSSMMSELLGHNVTLRISTNAMRTIDKYGNIDEFMLNYKHTDSFSTSAARIRKAIKKASARTAA